MSITSQFQSTLPVWGGTLPSGFSMAFSMMFQSTLPVWGGTPFFCRLPATRWRFNPPSPCGEGPGSISAGDLFSTVSIHPPRVGRDCNCLIHSAPGPDFNPPSPCGEGRMDNKKFNTLVDISIHPPRVGRDRAEIRYFFCALISIHPPRVGRDTVTVRP